MQTYTVGELEIVRVVELEFPLSREILAVGREPERLAAAAGWAKPHFVSESGDIVFALSATALVSDGKRIVIDPCLSFDLRRGNPDIGERAAALLDDLLPAAGYPPDGIDLVLNTHVDGVGWNVRPGREGWRPAFSRARTLWTRIDLDRVLRSDGERDFEVADAASLEPLLAAGRLEGVAADARITSNVSFRPSPGHTAGNVDIWIESNGETAVVVGDHILNPLQCADPDWTGLDMDSERSPGIRRNLLATCADRNTLIIGPHFGSPGAGYVKPEGDGWRLAAA